MEVKNSRYDKMTARPIHPSKDITGSDGNQLLGKTVVLCVTGSVAAYRAIDLARLLMRHGADVRPVMSDATKVVLSPEIMKWATGNKVVTRLTGDLEHIDLADFGRSDLIIVYPCTANTLGKAAHGIDDTPVTSVLSVALGSGVPLVIAPAMHEAMLKNSIISENLSKLARAGVTFVNPTILEGKAKVAEPEEVLRAVIGLIAPKSLAGRKVLVTAGSTIEYIDPIRVVTNLSSGKMGIALAKRAAKMGAEVTIIFGVGTEPPTFDNLIRVNTSSQMYEAVQSELGKTIYDVVFMAAAVADFSPEKKDQKIESRRGSVNLTLSPTRKIVDTVKKICPEAILVAFKAEWGLSESVLIEKAQDKLKQCGAEFVVANDLAIPGAEAGSDTTEVYVVGKDGFVLHLPLSSKDEIAEKLLETVSNSLSLQDSINDRSITHKNS